MLVSEEILETLEGIRLIECNVIVDSHFRGYLIDLCLEVNFNEGFNQGNERVKVAKSQ